MEITISIDENYDSPEIILDKVNRAIIKQSVTDQMRAEFQKQKKKDEPEKEETNKFRSEIAEKLKKYKG